MVLMHSWDFLGEKKVRRFGPVENKADCLIGPAKHDTLNIEQYDSPEFRKERKDKAKPFQV